ncbi:hypothetical protein DENSPDRAFT_886209 [Dentipellis sp. KUC8613]|nr:hypothetical protein DENSPDRAFT_886209 [Dentipellis sp. KUC8613]
MSRPRPVSCPALPSACPALPSRIPLRRLAPWPRRLAPQPSRALTAVSLTIPSHSPHRLANRTASGMPRAASPPFHWQGPRSAISAVAPPSGALATARLLPHLCRPTECPTEEPRALATAPYAPPTSHAPLRRRTPFATSLAFATTPHILAPPPRTAATLPGPPSRPLRCRQGNGALRPNNGVSRPADITCDGTSPSCIPPHRAALGPRCAIRAPRCHLQALLGRLHAMLRILKAPLGCLRALPSPLDAPLGCLRAQLGRLHSIAPSSAPAVPSAPHAAVFGPHGAVCALRRAFFGPHGLSCVRTAVCAPCRARATVFGPHGAVLCAPLLSVRPMTLPVCRPAPSTPHAAAPLPPSSHSFCACLVRPRAPQRRHGPVPSPSFYHQGLSLAALPAISCCGGPTVQAARPLAAPPAVLLLARLVIALHVLAMAQAARHPTRLCQSIRAARALAMVRAAPPLAAPLAILPLAHRVAAPRTLAVA